MNADVPTFDPVEVAQFCQFWLTLTGVDDLTEAGRDDSRSAADMSVAAMLKRAKFNHLDTGLILCAFAHGKANGDPWTGNLRLRHVARCVLRSHDPKRPPGPKPPAGDIPTMRAYHALRDALDKNGNGAVLPTHANMVLILKRDPLLNGLVQFNSFTGLHMLRKPVPVLDKSIPPHPAPIHARGMLTISPGY
jgi:hypothetical protein